MAFLFGSASPNSYSVPERYGAQARQGLFSKPLYRYCNMCISLPLGAGRRVSFITVHFLIGYCPHGYLVFISNAQVPPFLVVVSVHTCFSPHCHCPYASKNRPCILGVHIESMCHPEYPSRPLFTPPPLLSL